MPSAVIDLDDAGTSFVVRWGDFMTIVTGELTNAARVELAVLATARATKEPDTSSDPFPGAAIYPDEAQWFSESRLAVTGPNVAALLATEFRWTERAAAARAPYPVAAVTLGRIRAVVERLHRERTDQFRRWMDRARSGEPPAGEWRDPAEPPLDAVDWRDERGTDRLGR